MGFHIQWLIFYVTCFKSIIVDGQVNNYEVFDCQSSIVPLSEGAENCRQREG